VQQRTLIETFVRTLGEAGERGGFGFRAKEGCGDSVPRQNAALRTGRIQWSCHTIREKDGNLEHTEWINVVDAFPNFAFAEALMEQLGERGSFLMWSRLLGQW
jgi:hypothetical protein